MFYHCKRIKKLDLSHFNTINVVDMFQMFETCEALEELNIANFNMNNVNNINHMFVGCSEELKNSVREQLPNLPNAAFI